METAQLSESEGQFWEVATAQSTRLCSRVTGDVALDQFHLSGNRVYQALTKA